LFCPYRFLESKEEIDKVRKCFAGLWSLDDEEIIKTAVEKPELFVLKPQREGGGSYPLTYAYHFLLFLEYAICGQETTSTVLI
jgi:hypothetical protein